MSTKQERLDLLAELDAIVDLGRRAPGSDAERRTASHLERRLEALGRTTETESLFVHPAWPLAYALQAAAAALPEVRARGLHAVGRGHQHRLDDTPTVTASRFHDPDPKVVARKPTPYEHDVAVRPPYPVAAKGEVVDDELQRVAASRLCHGVRPL